MKYAIMSDIHGNLEAFRRAVADARKRKCKKIICLGDLTGYGKQSKECVEYAMQNVDMCLMRISPEDAELARSFDEDDKARGLRGLKEIGPKSCTVAGGARYVVNVGSVGLPREGPCGTYCTYDVPSGRLQFVFLEK